MRGVLTERRILSLVIFFLTAGLGVSTFGLTFADLGGAFSPMFFPRIILMVLLVLAVLNVIGDLMKPDAGQGIELWPVLIISIAFVLYVLLIIPLGYFISSTAVGIVILLAMGLRNPVQVVAVPVLSAGALVGLFNHVLTMPLPTSPFFWWM